MEKFYKQKENKTKKFKEQIISVKVTFPQEKARESYQEDFEGSTVGQGAKKRKWYFGTTFSLGKKNGEGFHHEDGLFRRGST